jgi:hypothetical protein
MLIIIGIGLSVVLLGFWLVGHWLARVLMFMVMAIVFGFGMWLWGDTLIDPSHPHPTGNAMGAFIGIALAWPISGIPGYQLRRQERAARRWARERWAM